MDYKECRHCKETKELQQFSLDKSSKDGHQKYCKECNKHFSRVYKERKASTEGRVMLPYKSKQYSTVSDEELLQIIKDFYNEFKRAPTTVDFDNSDKYPHFKTYYRHFIYYKSDTKVSSWNDILMLAGVTPLDFRDYWSAWQYLVELSASILEGDCLFQYCGFGLDFKPDIYIPLKHKVIDAATSNYACKHKEKQYKKATDKGACVEYWCLNKNNRPGLNFPNLKYVFADDIIIKLSALGYHKLCYDIKNLHIVYKDFKEEYQIHKKDYVIKKLKEFKFKNGRTPYCRDFICNPDYPSSSTITNLFGTFNNALLASKLKINTFANLPFNEKVAKDDLLNFINSNGRLPLCRELGRPNTTFTKKVYFKYWGGIEGCVNSIGLNYTKLKYSASTLNIKLRLDQIIEFKTLHNRMPAINEFGTKNNLPSYHWVNDNFGSYENLTIHLENSIEPNMKY
ncbi:MAG: homing endonuclease associated repeat-containing protein [Clostridium sp.]|uniref:homing endonuclease associated repeat-containing protein n=1 Tax=Clostridium sp. TaxID=1506 RepID=UPI003D6CDC44